MESSLINIFVDAHHGKFERASYISSIVPPEVATINAFTVGDLFYTNVERRSIVINHDKKRYLITVLYSVTVNEGFNGCEGDLAATSVTPLIARVDSADLAG